ncbi:MAG: DUF192 domain-containing protein [Myxococcota bacterium]
MRQVHYALIGLACMIGGACAGTPRPAENPEQAAEQLRPAPEPAGQGTFAKGEDPIVTPPAQATAVRLETESGVQRVSVELAVTPEARRKGLMGREVLAQGDGMLFVFDTESVQTFWMRNTLIALDMIFISGPPSGEGAHVVGIVHGAPPHSTQLRSIKKPSRFVLEVPGGWSRAHGLDAGDKVYFDGAASPEGH